MNPLGPDYWFTTFGITSFDDFKAAATPILDAGLWHISAVDNIALEIAWNNAGSVPGAYITAGLVATGFHEDSPSGPATVTWNSLGPLFQNNQQELSAVAGLVIAGCFQVTLQAVAGGHAIDNVIGVENASGTAAGAAAAVKAAWEASGGPISTLQSGYAMTNYHAVDIGSLTGTIADLASTQAGTGGSGAFATRAASALIKWNGSNRSRSTRGRLYLGPLSETAVNSDGATISTTAQTSISNAITVFRNSLNTAGYPLVVLSRKTLVATVVSSHAVEAQIATQRRRIRN